MSNKTPKDSHAKIESALKSGWIFAFGILLLLLVLILNPTSKQTLECLYYRTPVDSVIKINDQEVKVETAKTREAKSRGLSGRPCIKLNQAMLFVFDETDLYPCFWMKYMRFPIDIVWLDKDQRVVKLLSGVEPISFPNSYCPKLPSQYVLEFKAQETKRLNIHIGDYISI